MKKTNTEYNKFSGDDIGTLILDNDLKIVRYTEEAKRILKLKDPQPGQQLPGYDIIITGAHKALETLTTYEKRNSG